MNGRVPSRGSDQFNLRLPDGMRDALKQAADAAGRSTNAEIVARLQASLDNASGKLSDEERSNIVIATTMQIMVGLRSAIAEIPKEERGDIEDILDVAYEDLISRMTSSGVKTK